MLESHTFMSYYIYQVKCTIVKYKMKWKAIILYVKYKITFICIQLILFFTNFKISSSICIDTSRLYKCNSFCTSENRKWCISCFKINLHYEDCCSLACKFNRTQAKQSTVSIVSIAARDFLTEEAFHGQIQRMVGTCPIDEVYSRMSS